MAAPRGMKTSLAFGLVTCDVALFKTSGEPEKVKWEYAGPNGGALTLPGHENGDVNPASKHEHVSDPLAAFAEMVDEPKEAHEATSELVYTEEGTGASVKASERRKGMRREDGTFLDLTDGLQEIAERTKLEEMRVADFIRTEEVRRERVIGSYYLTPDGPGAAKVVRLLHEAMRETKRVAVVKLTKRSKQSLGALIPDPDTHSLILLELAWAADVRARPEKAAIPTGVAVTAAEVKVAIDLVNAMCSTRREALDTQEDDARGLTADLIAKAERGDEFVLAPRPEVSEGADVIDLMQRGLKDRDALKRAAA